MPEVSNNAAIFIAQSWQAQKRAEYYERDLRYCNSIVCLIFACFYLEETLNVIKEQDGNKKNHLDFLDNIKNPGLFQKMCWFYNSYISEIPVEKYKQFVGKDFHKIMGLLNDEFENFDKLYNFRNNLSHGKINNNIAKNFGLVLELRQSAKDIVENLLSKANLQHIRNVKYKTAVNKLVREYQDGT